MNNLEKIQRSQKFANIAIVGLIIIVISLLFANFLNMSSRSAKSASSPGTCMPISKGGTGCDFANLTQKLDPSQPPLNTFAKQTDLTATNNNFANYQPKIADTGWQTAAQVGVTFSNGITPITGQPTLQFRKIGSIVFVRGVVNIPGNLTITNNMDLFLIPNNWRPISTVFGQLGLNPATTSVKISYLSTGNAQINVQSQFTTGSANTSTVSGVWTVD